jgi:hypothetical protein
MPASNEANRTANRMAYGDGVSTAWNLWRCRLAMLWHIWRGRLNLFKIFDNGSLFNHSVRHGSFRKARQREFDKIPNAAISRLHGCSRCQTSPTSLWNDLQVGRSQCRGLAISLSIRWPWNGIVLRSHVRNGGEPSDTVPRSRIALSMTQSVRQEAVFDAPRG